MTMKNTNDEYPPEPFDYFQDTNSLCNKLDLEDICGFYRLDQIIEFIPMSKSSWWAGVSSGKFPEGYKIGKNITVWLKTDILKLL